MTGFPALVRYWGHRDYYVEGYGLHCAVAAVAIVVSFGYLPAGSALFVVVLVEVVEWIPANHKHKAFYQWWEV